jgi:hypothetical protein
MEERLRFRLSSDAQAKKERKVMVEFLALNLERLRSGDYEAAYARSRHELYTRVCRHE